jgi:hypothetical protein
MAERAKRRSAGQKIGRDGELVFERWANRNGLSVNKSVQDMGIDYFCEHLKPITPGVEEVSGVVVAVQVKATSGKSRPRIRLERTGIETALRLQAPFCLVGVATESDDVGFRFLDEELLEEWSEFLKSTNQFRIQSLDRMQTGIDAFARGLRGVSRPGFRHRLEQRKAEIKLQAVLPDAALQVCGGPGGWTLVTVPTLSSILRLNGETERERAMRILFTPQPFSSSFETAARQFALHEPFRAVADLADGPVLITGAAESNVKLFVEWKGQREESDFVLRRVEDERAYIGASGLVLRVSDARQGTSKGVAYHYFSSAIESAGAADLSSSGQLPFLRLLRPGALVNEVGRAGVAIKMFRLQHIGAAIAALETVFSALNIPLVETQLADFNDSSFALKIGFLEAALDKNTDRPLIPTFVIGLDESVQIDECNFRSCKYRVPLVLNIKARGVVLWTEGDADAYVHHGTIHGFRFNTATEARVETTPSEHANVSGIEAWIYQDWAPLPLAQRHGRSVTLSNSRTLPFGGEFSIAKERAAGETAETVQKDKAQ